MAAEKARRGEITWSSISFADDTSISFSIDLNDSVFDTTDAFDTRSTSMVGEEDSVRVSDDSIDAGKMETDTPLSQAYNVGGKRFERMLDASCIKNDVIKLNPVSNKN